MTTPATSRRARPFALTLALALLLAAVAATVTWATPSNQEGATLDGGVLVEPPPYVENLGFDAGSIAPSWFCELVSPSGGGDAQTYDAAASGLRTVYVTGYTDQELLSLAKYVDGTLSWVKRYYAPLGTKAGGTAVAVRGSAVYTAGYLDCILGGLVLIRWDSSGNRVWTRTYVDARLTKDVAVDANGNVNVLGAIDKDCLLISYKADGTRRYVRRYAGPTGLGCMGEKMLLDATGNIYIAGVCETSAGLDAMVVKYSPLGTRLWARRVNGSASGTDWGNALRPRPGGGVYVAGYTTSTVTGRDGLLLGYTAGGERVLKAVDQGSETPGGLEQEFVDLEVLPGGNVLCGGYDRTMATGEDRYRAEFSPTGSVVSRLRESAPYADDERVSHMAKDSQGGVYLTGNWPTGASTEQIYTERLCAGGTSWKSTWPVVPADIVVPYAMATNGVNVYVGGIVYTGYTWQNQIMLGYVY